MKLPEDKKERTKVLALIGIGVLLAIAGIFNMPGIGILPLMNSKKAKLIRIGQLKEDILKADKEIKLQERDKAECRDVLQKINDISDKHILAPVLGINYKLKASEYIDPTVKTLGLKIEQFRQIGVSAEANQTSLKSYTARISLICSYDELRKLLKEIEINNPFLSVLNISIVSQSPETKERHLVAFDIEWPIWAEPELGNKFAKQLADMKSQEAGSK